MDNPLSHEGPGRALTAALEAMWPRVGPYNLLRRVGEGGMGVIYHAQHTTLEREVAVKFLWPHLAERPHSRERFLAEGRAASRIWHPNVVACYDLGQMGGAWFLAYAWLPGGDAAQRCLRLRGLPEREALTVVRDAARGVAAIHAAGVIHRDLKPDNLLFDANGHAVVCDLGIARLSTGGHITEDGKAVGTPEYMAPEQAQADPTADHRVDIYALGATLWSLVAGRPPFEGPSTWAVLNQVVNEPFPDPRSLCPDLGSAATAVILTACARDPAHRYPDALSLAGDLDLILAGLPARCTRPPPPQPSVRIAVSPSKSRLGNLRVLVVDGDRLAARFYEERLRKMGIDVDEAEGVAAARSKWDERVPDLVLLDLMLPDGSGLELLTSMRALAPVPVVAFSASNARDEIEAATAAGASAVLVKSRQDPRQVVELVLRLLGGNATVTPGHDAPRVERVYSSDTFRSRNGSGLRTQFVPFALEVVGSLGTALEALPVDKDGQSWGLILQDCAAQIHSLVGAGSIAGMAPVAALAELAEGMMRLGIDHPLHCSASFRRTLIQAIACLTQLLIDHVVTARIPHLAVLRVLVVDDDPIQLRLCREAMRIAGLPAETYESSSEALVAARKGRYSLVVSDVLMPDLNGFQFVTAMRQDRRHAGIPVVFVTAMADFGSFLGGNLPANTDIIAKPILVQELATKAMAYLLLHLARETAER